MKSATLPNLTIPPIGFGHDGGLLHANAPLSRMRKNEEVFVSLFGVASDRSDNHEPSGTVQSDDRNAGAFGIIQKRLPDIRAQPSRAGERRNSVE